MAKLPFKVAPAFEPVEVGNPKVGIIELPLFGDLTVREQSWINDQLATNSTFLEIARISNKVAKAQKIDPLAAHRFLTKTVAAALARKEDDFVFTEKEENWRVKYAREIEELCAFLLRNQWDRQAVTAAALIRFRVDGMEDFTADDARDLGQTLIQEIYAVALTEQTASGDGDSEEDEDQVREDLGKSTPELTESLQP